MRKFGVNRALIHVVAQFFYALQRGYLMQKVSAIILFLLYFSFTLHGSLQVHYCMGAFVKLSLFSGIQDSCIKCGMKKHNEGNSCCKDVSIEIKQSKRYLSSTSLNIEISPQIKILAGSATFSPGVILFTDNPSKVLYNFIPPPGTHSSLYIQNRILRI